MAASHSMTPEDWERAVSGAGCPFCSPRADDNAFWIKIQALGASTLYLSRDQRFLGRCLLILDGPHAVGLTGIAPEAAHELLDDLLLASRALERATGCDILNHASLGNQIAHLHWHLIPRSQGDARWGAPPWTTEPADLPERHVTEPELRGMADAIGRALRSDPAWSPALA